MQTTSVYGVDVCVVRLKQVRSFCHFGVGVCRALGFRFEVLGLLGLGLRVLP